MKHGGIRRTSCGSTTLEGRREIAVKGSGGAAFGFDGSFDGFWPGLTWMTWQ
jgi:hypothetical protein